MLIADVGNLRRPYPDWKTKEFLPLREYLRIAKSVILKHRPYLLADEDCLSHVVYYIIKADWSFDPDKGIDRKVYLGFIARKGVQTAERLREPSYNEDYPENYAYDRNTYVELAELIDGVKLTKKQRKMLYLFLEGHQYVDIARQYQVSRQTVRMHVEAAIKKVRKQNGLEN